jgi:hypothetical protein
MIELKFEEAIEIMRIAIKKDGREVSDFPADVQGQAITGIVGMFRVAQEMGYEIKRPANSIFSK